MFKKILSLSGTAVMSAVFVMSFALSATVFAGEGLDPCGPNLTTGFSQSAEFLTIGVDDIHKDFSKNTMNDYDDNGNFSPWSSNIYWIKTVYIDEGVYSIGEYAFYDSLVETVYIPDTVTSIGACAFLYCEDLKTVYYGGTEEEWDKLKNNIKAGNECFLNADIYCMDKGKLVIDLTELNAKVEITRNQEKAISNTLDFFVDCGKYDKQEDPRTGYDFDKDGEWDWLYNYEDGHVFIERTTDSGKLYDVTEADHKAVFINNDKSIYNYCMNARGGALADPDYRKAYYSDIQFIFRIQDLGELVVDLRDGSFSTDYKNMSMTIGSFEEGYYMLYGSGLILTDSTGTMIDIDLDGIYDVKYEDDGNTMTLYPIDPDHKNTKISVAGDKDLSNLQKSHFMANYSTLYFKFKDDLVKVDKVPATCDKDGTEEYWKSTDNSNIYSDKDGKNKLSAPVKIAAKGHSFGSWSVSKNATVTEQGEESRTCSVCGKKETRKTAMLTPTPTAKSVANPTPPIDVILNLDKTEASVLCGKTTTLKVLNGNNINIKWTSSDPKVATVDQNGKVTAKMAGAVTITASAVGKNMECKVTVLYKDVTSSKDFWYSPTNYLTAAGVVKGYDKQTKFKPANKCTRAQMVTFIWRLMGEPAPKTKVCKFKDVKEKDYFYKACLWGNEKGIVEGYKNGTFGPQIVCARKHAVTFLWRLAGKPAPKSDKNKFKDVKKSDYFYKATIWASEENILAGYKDGTFKPNGDCLRRQMVTFLYKFNNNIKIKK